MNCPFCQKRINAFTGFQEIVKFQAHLARCRKKPQLVGIMKALEIRGGIRSMKTAPHPDEARDDGMRAVVLFWARFHPDCGPESPFILPSDQQTNTHANQTNQRPPVIPATLHPEGRQ